MVPISLPSTGMQAEADAILDSTTDATKTTTAMEAVAVFTVAVVNMNCMIANDEMGTVNTMQTRDVLLLPPTFGWQNEDSAVTGTPHQRLRSVCVTACDFECESQMSDKILGFPKLILSSFSIHQTTGLEMGTRSMMVSPQQSAGSRT
eukprot:2568488-Rhodomonas_salina.1